MNEQIKRYYPTKENFKEFQEKGYSAVRFEEYNTEIDRVRHGEEDFSQERWQSWTFTRFLYLPTGKLNKAGQTRWEYEAPVVCGGDVRRCKKVAKMIYGEQVSMRTA